MQEVSRDLWRSMPKNGDTGALDSTNGNTVTASASNYDYQRGISMCIRRAGLERGYRWQRVF